MHAIYFDDAIPTLVHILNAHLSAEIIQRGVILRDASGRLTFFAPPEVAMDLYEVLEKALAEKMAPYGHIGRHIVLSEENIHSHILESAERIPIQIGDLFCNLIDRRIVGSGWLALPEPNLAQPPRIVFATLKGGVGRSTALAITAADLANRNNNILVIDLDLEAPGLGNLMLSEDRVPKYGVIDFLVENGLGEIPESLLSSFIGTSDLTSPDGGRVDVMPALGTKSLSFPENVLGKLSRAMSDDIADDGSISVSAQISTMIQRVTSWNSYDVILIDSRAGLAELAAPAVIGIGATVLLFGTAQKQTIEGYRALFAALQLLAQRDRTAGRSAEWRSALRPVYAKASLSTEIEKTFLDDMFELYTSHIYDAEQTALEDGSSLTFVQNDTSAPHWPLLIPFNQSFIDFDPSRTPGQLSKEFYEQTFRPFLNTIDEIIKSSQP